MERRGEHPSIERMYEALTFVLRFFRRVMLGVGAQFMQQLCGINLITYYAPGKS
jgi:hypothetical protein